MSLKQTWFSLTDDLLKDLADGEELSIGLVAENSLFLRFNSGKLRQGTCVQQATVELQFQKQNRKVNFNFSITEDHFTNLSLAQDLLKRARQEVQVLTENPNCSPLKNEGSSDQDLRAHLPSEKEAIEQIIEAHGSVDFAGFYSGGPVYRASRNSAGQNHWYSTECFFYDYSLFTKSAPGADGKTQNKAVKGNYSEKNWSELNLKHNIQSNNELLINLQKPSRKLPPGAYRAFLAPGAVGEILGTLVGAFGASQFKQGRSAFARLANQQDKLSPLFSLTENFNLAAAPQFNSLGEMAPRELTVVAKGQLANWIVSSKTAKEFGLVSNAGEITGWSAESLRSAEVSAGTLPTAQALEALGTGVWLGNLHYLNWSDVSSARVTGMTRYACFWVENAQIVAPIDDMRFDESIYRIFGDMLEALTIEQTLEPDILTYWKRQLGARKVPGALVKEFKFTL